MCLGREWEGGEKYFTCQMLTLISTNLALRKLLQNPVLGALKLLKGAEKVEKVTSLVTTNPPQRHHTDEKKHDWIQEGISLRYASPGFILGLKAVC